MKKTNEKEMIYICSLLRIIGPKVFVGNIVWMEKAEETEKTLNSVEEYYINKDSRILYKSKITIYKDLVRLETTKNGENSVNIIEQNDPNNCSFMDELGEVYAFGTLNKPFDITKEIPRDLNITTIKELELLEKMKEMAL